METPRTNKNAGYYCGHGVKKNGDLFIDPNGPFVLADFARELERENARLRNALEVLRDRREWISATDVDAFIRNALLPNDQFRDAGGQSPASRDA